MKSVLLMRHAKAEPQGSAPRDADRPLAPRGRDDAEAVGRRLLALDRAPDVVLTSTAVRARETAELAARAAGFERTPRLDPSLYDAPGSAWIAAIRKLPASSERALVVGHVPGVEEAAALLIVRSGARSRATASLRFPTGGVALVEIDVASWTDLRPGAGSLRWFFGPKVVRQHA